MELMYPAGAKQERQEMVKWITHEGLTTYPEAMAAMDDHVNAMIEGRAGEAIWLLEHPPLYTGGTSAKHDDLLMIATLAQFNVTGKVDPARVGVWVERPEKARLSNGLPAEDKVAAIGIRVRKWVAFHGISINVEPDLEHFSGIVPCGINDYGVTSLVDLGLPVTLNDLDIALKQTFTQIFD